MKKLILAAASIAALALVGPASAQSPIIIKFSHVVAPNTPKGLATEKFKELAEKYTAGKVKVEVYPNSQLYKDKEELEALQLGAVQMLAPSLAKFSPLGVREFEAFDLPYIFPDKAALYKVTEGRIGREPQVGEGVGVGRGRPVAGVRDRRVGEDEGRGTRTGRHLFAVAARQRLESRVVDGGEDAAIEAEVPTGAPRDHPQLHRRQVLRLVHDHVVVRARRHAHQRMCLVQERHVRCAPLRPTPAQQPLLLLVEDSVRRRGEEHRGREE